MVLAQCVLMAILSFQDSRCDSRRAAEYLADHTRKGDTVVFASLSRLPIDYYWDRIQPGRKIRERSFPASTDSHPGYEGVPDTMEASRLASELGQRPGTRAFFLRGFAPQTDALLGERLQAEFSRVESLDLSCRAMGSYFQFVQAYSCGADESPRHASAMDRQHPATVVE